MPCLFYLGGLNIVPLSFLVNFFALIALLLLLLLGDSPASASQVAHGAVPR